MVYESEKEAKTPLEKSYFWPRVIRPVIRKHRHVIMDMCSPLSGKTELIERRIIAKSHGLHGGYRMAKRIKWGDLWYFDRRIPNKYTKERKHSRRLW